MTIAAIVAGTGFYSPAIVGTSACRAGSKAILRREPFNPHDRNAIAVVVEHKAFGIFPSSTQIGHLKAPLARRLAPQMDAGKRVTAVVTSVFNPPGQSHPRVSLTITVT